MFVSLNSNTTVVTSGTGTVSLSGAHEVIHGFSGVRVVRSLVFYVAVFTSLFVLLSFSFGYCVLFHLRILITSLWYLRFTDSDYIFGIYKLLLNI
jgi:hypothetical protein